MFDVINHDAIGMNVGNFGVEEFDVGDDLFLEVELEGEDGSELLEDVASVGMVSALDGCSDKFVELVVVNAPVVGALGSAEDYISDVGADFVGDGLSGPFYSSGDGLIDLVDAVGFILCVSVSGDGWEHRELGS